MAYSNFTIAEVELQFDLQLQAVSFLLETTPIAPSDLLTGHSLLVSSKLASSDNICRSVKEISKCLPCQDRILKTLETIDGEISTAAKG